MAGINLTAEQVFAINMALAKGQRIEIIPLKDRIKVVAVKRDELKTKYRTPPKSVGGKGGASSSGSGNRTAWRRSFCLRRK